MRVIDVETRLCAVIGNPVSHSLSPAIHNAAFQSLDLNCVYLAFEVTHLRDFLNGMRAMPNFRGVSVTIPHKIAVMDMLDSIDPLALQIGSVNTLSHDGGQLSGSNTDGPGALRAFDEAHISIQDKRILFLGAGGAVRAVAFALANRNPSAIAFLGRTPEKVRGLADDLLYHYAITIETGHLIHDIETFINHYDIIINGTPLGMYPEREEHSPVPEALLRDSHVVFDMVYRPRKTKLIREAEDAGCKTIHGLEMLLNQATIQFETWTGIKAPATVMREKLLSILNI